MRSISFPLVKYTVMSPQVYQLRGVLATRAIDNIITANARKKMIISCAVIASHLRDSIVQRHGLCVVLVCYRFKVVMRH